MATVMLSGETNSQTFTTCCQVAICDDQEKCPICKQVIEPLGRYRWQSAYARAKRIGYGR